MLTILRLLQLAAFILGNCWHLLTSLSLGLRGRPSEPFLISWIVSIVAESLIWIAVFMLPPKYPRPDSQNLIGKVCLLSTVAFLFLPIVVQAVAERLDERTEEKSQKAAVDKASYDLSHLEQTIDKHIRENRVLSPEETLDALSTVFDSDLRYRGLPDFSESGQAFMERAFAAKIVDPNSRVKGVGNPKFDGQPIYAYLYFIYTPATPHQTARMQRLAWMLHAFADAGADRTQKGIGGKTILDYIHEIENALSSR
jgi:hypothetical protein